MRTLGRNGAGAERNDDVAQQTRDVLLAFLRERQPEQFKHLREVGRLATMIGRRLGMAAQELDELQLAAELHDIGKAAIPDAILNKAGALSDAEWKFMLRHTIVGERILGSAPALGRVAKLVRSSHERWDGGGYPDGLAAGKIPLGARIIFVCDAFTAMTSERPYYPARHPDEAILELRGGAGTQFDPRVVEALVNVVREDDRYPATDGGSVPPPAKQPEPAVSTS